MSKLKSKANKGAYIRNAHLIGVGEKPAIQIKPQEFDKAAWDRAQDQRVSKLKQKAINTRTGGTTTKPVTPPSKTI